MKWRLLGALVALTAIVLLIQDIPLAAYLRTVESNRIIAELQTDAFVIAGRSEQVLQQPNQQITPALQNLLDEYAATENADVIVVNRAGEQVASTQPLVDSQNSDTAEIDAALMGSVSSGEMVVGGVPMLFVSVPVLSGARTLGAVRVNYPAAQLDSQVNDQVRAIALVAGLTLLVAIGMAFILAGNITRPITRLKVATSQLARGNLAARAPTDSGAPELRQLGVDLNSMANQLNELLESQRSFASDASHQLRTPLTALRIRLDQAADELDSDPGSAAETIDEARAETERLQHVIDGLLRLARAEGRAGAVEAMNLSEILADRVAMWEPLAEERGVQLAVTAPDRVTILAAASAPEQIVDNYLDNAISVSPTGSVVLLSIATLDNGGVQLAVSDQGPGLTAEQRARAFDRFWSMREDNAGTGLGLAIVRQLALASDATVELRPSRSGGIDAVAVFRSST